MWAGTWGGGLFKQDGDGFTLPVEWVGLSAATPAILPTAKRGLLVGSSKGLAQDENGKLTWLACAPQLGSPDVRAIAESSDGTLWLGMSGGGIASLKDGKLRQFRHEDGLSSDYVRCLHLESDGALWIGTFNGLNRFENGRFGLISKKQGLPNDVICDIQDDRLGNFWISTQGGITNYTQQFVHAGAVSIAT